MAARIGAIYTGLVASITVVVSLVWFGHPRFGYWVGDPVVFIAFLSGFLGAVAVVGVGLSQAAQVQPSGFGALLKAIPPLLQIWLALLLVAAVVSFAVAASRAGKWGADPPGSGASRCHWPLSANHDTEHECVSHARWLEVRLQGAHMFVGFGALFCILDCAAFTALSRLPRQRSGPG